MAFDLMDFKKRNKIIFGIDFFSRKMFGEKIESKEAIKTIDFLK